MPISKRDKEVSLTKTKRVTKEKKSSLINELRSCVDKYANVYVFTTENLRGTALIQVRQQLKGTSRIFFGKNNLMAHALGRTAEDEVAKDLHQISASIKGECGLLFTNETPKAVKQFFKSFAVEDYARAGSTAEEDVVLPAGHQPQFIGPIEPHLRKLGLPSRLDDGHVELTDDFTVCEVGDVLTPEQSKILKLFNIKTTTFKMALKAHWTKEKGFKEL